MEVLHHEHTGLSHFVIEVDVGEELLCYTLQGIFWPLREPVDGGTVDQTWEVSDAISKGVADRTEAHHNVKVSLATLNKVRKELLWGTFWASALLLGNVTHRVAHVNLLICREDVGHLTRVQDVVDVLEEALLLDTVVSEDERVDVTFTTDLSEQNFEILTELNLGVNFLNFNLEDFSISHPCSQTRQRLTARATHTHEQGVTTWLHQDSTDSQQMFDSEIEKHQVHNIVSHFVVPVKCFFGSCDEFLFVEDFFVRAIWNTKWREHITKDISTEFV